MVWTRAKAVVVLVAVDISAKGFFSSLNQKVAAWIPAPTTTDGISKVGSPSIGGRDASGDGTGPSADASTGGTMIISWSTQYFTVTTGITDSSQTGPITDDGIMASILAGNMDSILAGSMDSIPTGSLGSSASASGTSPGGSALPSAEVFVIEVVTDLPSESGVPGRLARRQDSSEFVTKADVDNPSDCSQAIRFELIDGELTSGGQKVSTSPGVDSGLLATRPTVGSITRTWDIVDGELFWRNSSFVGGQAAFCVDSGTRRVFFTTTGAGNEPDGCTPKQLTPMLLADCPLLSHGAGLLPAEETLILPPGIYFPGSAPNDWACRVTTEYWTVGQFTVAPAPTGLSKRLW